MKAYSSVIILIIIFAQIYLCVYRTKWTNEILMFERTKEKIPNCWRDNKNYEVLFDALFASRYAYAARPAHYYIFSLPSLLLFA